MWRLREHDNAEREREREREGETITLKHRSDCGDEGGVKQANDDGERSVELQRRIMSQGS